MHVVLKLGGRNVSVHRLDFQTDSLLTGRNSPSGLCPLFDKPVGTVSSNFEHELGVGQNGE